jgi:hypothetical protein
LKLGHKALRFVAAIAFLSLAGCEPACRQVPAWSPESDFPLTLGGGGWTEFSAHADGAPVYLERGFQGGQHVPFSLRVVGFESEILAKTVTWLVARSSESLLAGPDESTISLIPPDPSIYAQPPADTVETLGLILFVPDPDIVLGVDAELRVQASLDDGRIGRAAMRGEVEWLPEGNASLDNDSAQTEDADSNNGVSD